MRSGIGKAGTGSTCIGFEKGKSQIREVRDIRPSLYENWGKYRADRDNQVTKERALGLKACS
jgi:hypothetical protein